MARIIGPRRALTLAPRKGGGFSLAAFMAAQSDGFWYDFGQTDRLFQENVGPTPADEPNEAIGLALSSRLWSGKTLAQILAEASSVYTPGLSVDASTAPATSSESPAGTINLVATGTGQSARRDLSFPSAAGATYAVTISSISGSSALIRAGTSAGGLQILGDTTLTVGGQRTIFITATTTTTFLRLFGGTNSTVVMGSIKAVLGRPATQATGTLKPKFQTTGAAFDGSDDNLLTGYTASSTENFIVAKVTVPATISATQVICGAWVAGPTDFFFLGLSTTGLVRCGVGGVAATASAGSDLRGTEAVIGLSFDATTVRMFAGGAEVNSAPRSGNPTTVTPVRIGATNAAGSASNLFGGSVKSIVAGRQFLDLSTFNKIAAAL